MIQRVQTLYLLLAGLLPAITFIFPVALLVKGDAWLSMTSFAYDMANVDELVGRHPWWLAIIELLTIVLTFIALFSYKNRKKQIKWIHFALASNMVWCMVLIAYAFSIAGRTGLDLSFSLCSISNPIAMVALLMAQRAIKKDELLVKAADRIR